MSLADTQAAERTAEEAVLGLWAALSDRDWDRVGSFIADDGIYLDVPLGPSIAAKGPDGVVKRLKLPIAPLANYVNHPGVLVTNGVDAMYEHSETWTWHSGETMTMQFVSVHRVVDGKIALWKDYWDMSVLQNGAPQGWFDEVQAGDVSWLYDATGEV